MKVATAQALFRRGGKTVTVVFDLPRNPDYFIHLVKKLKAHCGTGGALKEGQMAEVSITRNLFAAFLKRIRRLMQPIPVWRPKPVGEIKGPIRERGVNGLQAVWLQHHILKNGLKTFLETKIRTNDRYDVESTSKIVVLEVRGAVWAGFTTLPGKCRLDQVERIGCRRCLVPRGWARREGPGASLLAGRPGVSVRGGRLDHPLVPTRFYEPRNI